jgi:hypothetical protein
MEDFTGGAIHDQPTRRQWTVDPPFDARVCELVREWGAEKSPELIEEMIVTALKIARDRMTVADLKLINRSIKEMRNAAKVFAPFQHLRKVAVFGSARVSADSPEFKVAEDFGREMVAHKFMVITGGGDGIMGAAQRGAGRKHSFGINIRLAFEQRANAIIEGDPKLINLNYFYPQTDLRERGACIRTVSRRFRYARRNVRSAHAHANRESAYHSSRPPGSTTRKLLGHVDEISS